MHAKNLVTTNYNPISGNTEKNGEAILESGEESTVDNKIRHWTNINHLGRFQHNQLVAGSQLASSW